MPNELSELQRAMLEMMKWFHNYCVQNNITYYTICGSMIGAARHKGFIPWDDDIDVGIPRKDYDRLIRISKKLNIQKDRYIIESYRDNNSDFQYACGKVYDTHTTLIENKRIKTKRGIFIDIFPIDGIGKSYREALSNYRPIKRQLILLTLKTSDVRKGRSWYKNLIIKIMGLVPDSILSVNNIVKKIDILSHKHSYDDSRWCGALYSVWGTKEIVKKEVFGKPTLYKFEDTEIYGVEKYDQYLTSVYGDWRKMPPMSKRVTHHDFEYLNLNEPFISKKIQGE